MRRKRTKTERLRARSSSAFTQDLRFTRHAIAPLQPSFAARPRHHRDRPHPIGYLDFTSPETHREWGEKIAIDPQVVKTVNEK
jgi:hypothetical protein